MHGSHRDNVSWSIVEEVESSPDVWESHHASGVIADEDSNSSVSSATRTRFSPLFTHHWQNVAYFDSHDDLVANWLSQWKSCDQDDDIEGR